VKTSKTIVAVCAYASPTGPGINWGRFDASFCTGPAEKGKDDGEFLAVQQTVRWDPKKTVLIVCDMWDDNTCKAATHRVVIPNFNDNYKDKAPDIGAHERGTPRKV
jgi:hypothetical protein